MTTGAAAPPLALRVNGREQEAPAHWTVADLVGALAGEARMVAVERNGVIVPRARWAGTRLAAGDNIELVRFVQGG